METLLARAVTLLKPEQQDQMSDVFKTVFKKKKKTNKQYRCPAHLKTDFKAQNVFDVKAKGFVVKTPTLGRRRTPTFTIPLSICLSLCLLW